MQISRALPLDSLEIRQLAARPTVRLIGTRCAYAGQLELRSAIVDDFGSRMWTVAATIRRRERGHVRMRAAPCEFVNGKMPGPMGRKPAI